ncbi:MAG: response regulator [endosymbiont of Galathealinum brachiosum]|uniref:Response regulator n=1 Tax=endosymbiont of Galathealinum brachiosum TaxID=2200906 RepID=A0A370DNL7_9GAMM|nr:MAG: response regulator [endosymbiont of Galathealinum brachiosum]
MFKTLLVEDNLIYREELKNALQKKFVNLETKESVGESDTLDIVNTFDPDLVIMDIDLHSGINGLVLTKKLKDECPEAVVVILSQHDFPEYRSVAKQNGADFFISKSSKLENIFDYVSSVIDRKHEHH